MTSLNLQQKTTQACIIIIGLFVDIMKTIIKGRSHKVIIALIALDFVLSATLIISDNIDLVLQTNIKLILITGLLIPAYLGLLMITFLFSRITERKTISHLLTYIYIACVAWIIIPHIKNTPEINNLQEALETLYTAIIIFMPICALHAGEQDKEGFILLWAIALSYMLTLALASPQIIGKEETWALVLTMTITCIPIMKYLEIIYNESPKTFDQATNPSAKRFLVTYPTFKETSEKLYVNLSEIIVEAENPDQAKEHALQQFATQKAPNHIDPSKLQVQLLSNAIIANNPRLRKYANVQWPKIFIQKALNLSIAIIATSAFITIVF